MIWIFDRYLVQIFFRAFLISFCSLVGLYIIIDAFSNLDEFSERSPGLWPLLCSMTHYYGYRVSLFFDRLSGVITTLSAMFTFSWIQRTNELMPLLAAGVPIYRVIAPVLLAAILVSAAAAVNQELVIPHIAGQLQTRPDDDTIRPVGVHPTSDARGIWFSGNRCYRQEKKVKPAFVTLPPQVSSVLVELQASEARYVAPAPEHPIGGWILTNVVPASFRCSETILEPLGGGDYFLHTTIGFDQVSRHPSWFQFSSTGELLRELLDPKSSYRTEMEVLLHARFTRPLASLTLLFLGLPFVLSGTDRRMVSLVGASLVISIAFQAFCQVCQRLGNAECIPPPLAAWLPVLIFGTIAVGMFDLVRT